MRYIPTTSEERERMLRTIGAGSIDDLVADIPASVRLQVPLRLKPALGDLETIAYLRALAEQNGHADQLTCFVGAGAYDHFIPPLVW